MADPSLSVEIAIKAGKAVIGAEEVVRAEDKIEKGAGKIAREAQRAEKEMDAFAKRAASINATPTEKYAAAVSKADAALAKGKISHEIYNREIARQKTLLDKAKGAQDQAFGSQAIGQLQGMVGGYFTLQTALNLVAQGFSHIKAESQGALNSLRGLDESRRKLVQMADSPEDLQAMLSRADKAAKSSGVSRATAYDVLFQAKSFGFEKDYEQILGANEVIEAGAAAQLAGKVATMFGNKITGRQAINMALAAGKPSEVDAESIASSLAMALEGGRRVGATPDETFATVSAMSAAFKSPQVAADRIKALTSRFAKEGMGDVGIMGGFRQLKAMTPEQRGAILGDDQETNAAYEAIREFEGKIAEIQTAVRIAREGTGTSADVLSRGLGIAGGTPQTAASLKVRRGELSREIAREGALAGPTAGFSSTRDIVRAAGYRGLGPAGMIAEPAANLAGFYSEMLKLLGQIRDQGLGNRRANVAADALVPAN